MPRGFEHGSSRSPAMSVLPQVGAPAPRRWRARPSGVSRGDHRAVDHHRDAVGDAEHRVHVVLDQQDRVAGPAARPAGPACARSPRRPCRPAARRAAAPAARWPGTSRSRAGASGRGDSRPAGAVEHVRQAGALGGAARGRGVADRAARARPATSARAAGARACAARRQFSSTVKRRVDGVALVAAAEAGARAARLRSRRVTSWPSSSTAALPTARSRPTGC